MKKILCILMVCALVMGMTACSFLEQFAGNPTEPTTEVTEEPTEKATEVATDGATEEASEEVTEGFVESPSADPVEDEETTEEVPEISLEDIDISNAVESTSAENPAKLGEWVKSTRYSATSHEYEVVYWRVVGTTYDCQDAIDRYHAGNGLYRFDPMEDEDLAYCIVTYQVYYPEDFPAQEWGISSADLSLRATNPEGGGIEWKGVAYIGLGSCVDISVDQEIMPGDVYTGEAIYVMINDSSVNYVFEYAHPAEGADGEMLYDYVNCR